MIDPSLFSRLPLLADGSLATCLDSAARKAGLPLEALNFHDPRRVERAHRDFARSGAALLRTNTAQANKLALDAHSLAERAEAINNAGSALARAACSGSTVPGAVMGTLSPPLQLPPPGSSASRQVLEQAWSEQIVYLSDTGVDIFLLEHFTRLEELARVTALVKKLSDAPVLALPVFGSSGATADGASPREAALRLADAGADSLGAGCAPIGEALPGWMEALGQAGLPLALFARAGNSPGDGSLAPEDFAVAIADLARNGVSIVGGCCGVTPDHIRAMAEELRKDSAADAVMEGG